MSIDTYGIIVLYNPPNPSEYRVPDDVISNCLLKRSDWSLNLRWIFRYITQSKLVA